MTVTNQSNALAFLFFGERGNSAKSMTSWTCLGAIFQGLGFSVLAALQGCFLETPRFSPAL